MAKDKEDRKPLLFSSKKKSETERWYDDDNRAEREQPFRVTPPLGGWDSSYVPGYSDRRLANDLSTSNNPHYAGYEYEKLPIGLQWIRSTGKDDRRDFYPWRQKGYEIVEVDPNTELSETLTKHGYGRPPAAEVINGAYRKDDAILAWCPGDKLYENAEKLAEMRRNQSSMAEEKSTKVELTQDDVVWDR